MRFKGRGDYDVLSWRQMQTLRHFPQVNVALAFSFGGCVQEEVLLQVLILSTHLWTMKTIWSERNELGKIGTLLPRRTQEYWEDHSHVCTVDMKILPAPGCIVKHKDWKQRGTARLALSNYTSISKVHFLTFISYLCNLFRYHIWTLRSAVIYGLTCLTPGDTVGYCVSPYVNQTSGTIRL